MNENAVPSSYHSAVSRSGHPGRFHPDAAARDPIPRLAPGLGLIVALLLSVGLWGAVWLAASALAAVALVAQTRLWSERRSDTKLDEGGPNAVNFE